MSLKKASKGSPPRRASGARKRRSTSATRRRRASAHVDKAIDPRAPRLIARCENLLRRLGCSWVAVLVEVRLDGKLLAGAQGCNLNGYAVGRVIVDDYLLRLLPDDELEFVLAHEVAHIFRNHFAQSMTTAAVRALVEDNAQDDPGVKAALLAWDVWKVVRAITGHRSPAAEVTRTNELEADLLAVWLIGDKDVAKRSLLRLVEGDLNAPSHTWEVFGTTMPIPVLSMRERIAALDAIPTDFVSPSAAT